MKKIIFSPAKYEFSFFSAGRLRLKFALESLRLVKGRLLDLGSGDGRLGQKIKQFYPQLEIIGLEPDKKLVAGAKKRTAGVKGLSYLSGRGEKIPFPDNSFEAVLASCVLEHVDDYQKTLREISRVIKPGGIFHSVTPLEADPWVLHHWFREWIWSRTKRHLGHQHPFTRKELLAAIAKEGFVIKRTWSSQFFLFQIMELAYYFFINRLNLSAHFSVREMVQEKNSGADKRFCQCLLAFKGFLINLEWFFLRFLPGHLLHIEAIKS